MRSCANDVEEKRRCFEWGYEGGCEYGCECGEYEYEEMGMWTRKGIFLYEMRERDEDAMTAMSGV